MREATTALDPGARGWDVFCTANFLNFVPWTACINFFLQADLEHIAACDDAIVDKLVRSVDQRKFELLSPEAGAARSTLIVLRPHTPEGGKAWQRRLGSAGIDVALREDNLRIAPHVHNTVEDVDRLLSVIND